MGRSPLRPQPERDDVLARRPLGRTGLRVTRLSVGTAELGDMTSVYGYAVPQERAAATLRRVLSGPVNVLDTSNGYGAGVSERRIGSALREVGGLPDGFVLATKVDPQEGGRFDGPRVRESFEESLANLGVTRLQLLHLHDPERIGFDAATAPGGPVEVMRQLVGEGVVDHLGVAGGSVDLMRRLAGTGVFDVVLTHSRWTLLDRSAEPLLEQCVDAGIPVLNAAPFGGGLLARGPDAQSTYGYGPAPEPVLHAAREMQHACADHGVPLAAAALQLSLREPRIASAVVGMTRPERLDQTLQLARTPVPDELWERLAELTPSKEHWLR